MVLKRYSEGFLFIERLMGISGLCGFLDELFSMVSEERLWQFWLHRDMEMGWEDFKLSAIPYETDEHKLKKTQTDIEKALAEGVIKYGTI